MPESQMPKRMLTGRLHSRRKKGRPKKRWMDSVTVDLRVMGVRGWRSIGEALSKRPKPIKGCSACEEEDLLRKKQDRKDGVLFVRSKGRGRELCIGVVHVTDSVWNVFETTTSSSISKVTKYYSFIIFISFCAISTFIMQWCRFSDSVYFSERNVRIRMKRKLFIPYLLLLK
jgi:hypothetical protein